MAAMGKPETHGVRSPKVDVPRLATSTRQPRGIALEATKEKAIMISLRWLTYEGFPEE